MTAAFFDMDRTLIHVNSGREWVRYLRSRGEISLMTSLRALRWLTEYKLSILDMDTVSKRVVATMAGQSEDELRKKSLRFFREHVESTISADGRRMIEHHRALGHTLVLLTSSTPYVADPLARALGIDHVLCTRLGVRDGVFDGTLVAPACYGEGKVELAEKFCAAHDLSLEQSFFYTDSFSDLPMLERVGGARVVNPDARLRRFAHKVGWETLAW